MFHGKFDDNIIFVEISNELNKEINAFMRKKISIIFFKT